MKFIALLFVFLTVQFSVGAELEVRVYSTNIQLDENDDASTNSGVVGVFSKKQLEESVKGASADLTLKETRVIHDATVSWPYRMIPESEGLKGKYSGVAFSFDRVRRSGDLCILKAAYFEPMEMQTSLEVKVGDYVMFQHVDLAKGECLFYVVSLKGDLVE